MKRPVRVEVGYKFLVEQSDFPGQIGKLYTVSKIIDRYKSCRGTETLFALEEIPTTYDTFCGTFYKEVEC